MAMNVGATSSPNAAKHYPLEPIEELPQLEESQAGLTTLITDLTNLIDDRRSTDLIIVVGHNETPFYTHRLIMWARCQGFRQKYPKILSQTYNCTAPAILSKAHLDPVTFQQVVDYLYVGKIDLNAGTVFQILTVAEEFGIVSLRNACVDYIETNITVDNAINYFMAVRKIVPSPSSEDLKIASQVKNKCLTFIDDNAEDITKNEAFLHLDQDSLIELVSRNEFAISEEEVWRCVLRWVKHKANITGHVSTWSKEDKNEVCKYLSGVIDCVKLLLIDSKVFAEEIEPTGAVPMEVSLERYRYAAIPEAFDALTDRRLQPRKMKKMFYGSLLLTGNNAHYQGILNEWYGDESQQWHLIFRASRDGFSARQFHTHCDNIEPTFTIIKGSDENLCGGFSDQPWSEKGTCGSFTRSSRTFLFTLTNQYGVSPIKFDIVQEKHALVHDKNFGPTFGAGADLCIASNCDSNDHSYSNFPYSYEYDTQEASPHILMGSYNFLVSDYEVFTVK